MLAPRRRTLLLEALRPPDGYALGHAVGTSFTLDLLALMTAPLAFTFFDWEDEQGRTTADPLALLEAVRRHAGRIALFCQAGKIAVPASGRPLLTYLEGSVFEVMAPRAGGLFHPKIWLLRFVREGEPVRYRLLCLSRNLTFDRSWDTVLALDGVLTGRTRAIHANHSLGDFVGSLPEWAVRPVPTDVRGAIARMADEVRSVRFELPDGFDDYGFWSFGLGTARPWPFSENRPSRRMLVVSPFVSDGFLERIAAERDPGILLSRPESLAELEPETRARFEKVLVIHPSVDPEDEDEGAALQEELVNAPAELGPGVAEVPFTGLHAKLFVMDDGRDGRIWTGSANATDAAFSQNVEFLVELVGKKSFCGVDAMLGEATSKELTLAALLAPFQETDLPDPDVDERELEKEIEAHATALSRLAFTARASSDGTGLFTLDLLTEGEWPPVPENLRITCRPVTLPPGVAVPLKRGQQPLARFGPVSVDALTQFFAIDLRLGSGPSEKRARFVVNVPLEGAPEDRRDRVLRALLQNSEQVLRLIWLLLAAEDLSLQDWLGDSTGSGKGARGRSAAQGMPVLETMLKVLDRNPGKLDELERLVADLRRTPEGAALLPPGFDDIWEPIWQTRQGLR